MWGRTHSSAQRAKRAHSATRLARIHPTNSPPQITPAAAVLGNARNRDLFVQVLEHVLRRYHFVVLEYLMMPEHAHLLIREPERGDR